MACAMPIKTERLLIEEADADDRATIDGLVALFNSNPEFHRASGERVIWSAADLENYLADDPNPRFPDLESHEYTVRERATGQIIGTVELIAPIPSDRINWIALMMIQGDRQGAGLGSEVVAAIEHELFAAHWTEIRAFVHRDTVLAYQFWTRAGYQPVGEALSASGKPGMVLRKARP